MPFGQDWPSTGDLDECRFAQTERAPDTGAGSWEGLSYAGARYYHSQSGRFTSPDDPAYIDPLNPQTWNLYGYVMNNPLGWVDPTGRQGDCAGNYNSETHTCSPSAMDRAIERAHSVWIYVDLGIGDLWDSLFPPLQAPSPSPITGEPVPEPRVEPTLNPYLTAGIGLVTTKRWPPNRGFAGAPESVRLAPGARIDRYGSELGTFASPKGTPFAARSLPGDAASAPLREYEVLKPLPAHGGTTAPWFGQPGGGHQYEFAESIESLVEQGFLRRVP